VIFRLRSESLEANVYIRPITMGAMGDRIKYITLIWLILVRGNSMRWNCQCTGSKSARAEKSIDFF